MIRINPMRFLVVFLAWVGMTCDTGPQGHDSSPSEVKTNKNDSVVVVDVFSESRVPSLHALMSSGDFSPLKDALRSGADANETNKYKQTPLHLAATNGWVAVVSLLIDHGANVNARDSAGETPLHKASNMVVGNDRVIEELVDHGAYMNAKDNQGRTPLAVMIWKGNRSAISILIDKGADLNAVDNGGWTLLHLAIHNGDKKLCKMLLERGALPDGPDPEGRKPLLKAMSEGHFEIAKILLDHGARANVRDKYGVNPLQIAAFNKDWKMLELFLSKGADINMPGRQGESVLHKAALADDEELCVRLLRYGASPNKRDDSGRTPFHVASESASPSIVRLFIKNGAKVVVKGEAKITPLHLASNRGNVEIAKMLVDKGADVNAKDDMGLTPLHYATRARSCKVAELLISHGADIHARDNNCHQPSPYVCKIEKLYSSVWLDGEKLTKKTGLFFSYDKLIHGSHVKTGTKDKYHKIHIEKLRHIEMKRVKKRLPFSETLAEQFFGIRKGFFVAAFENSKRIFVDRISGFHTSWRGDYFEVSSGNEGGTLFLISKDRSSLRRVSERVVLGRPASEEGKTVERIVANRFIDDACDRSLLFNGFYNYSSLKDQGRGDLELSENLGKYVKMETRTLDFNADGKKDYLVTGWPRKKSYGQLNFTAVVSGKTRDVIWIGPHSVFRQVIKIQNRPYLFQYEYAPEKGEKGVSLYGFEGDKWGIVFADWSYSD